MTGATIRKDMQILDSDETELVYPKGRRIEFEFNLGDVNRDCYAINVWDINKGQCYQVRRRDGEVNEKFYRRVANLYNKVFGTKGVEF